MARWAARAGLTPNQVTVIALCIGLAAATAFATGERAGYIVGAVLVYLSFVADCVDGQLARYTRTFSKFGAWLDSVFDRAKEYVAFAGLAIGASSPEVWVLAAATLTLQTLRHSFDFSYGATDRQNIADTPQPPIAQSPDEAAARTRMKARGTLDAKLGALESRPRPSRGTRRWSRRRTATTRATRRRRHEAPALPAHPRVLARVRPSHPRRHLDQEDGRVPDRRALRRISLTAALCHAADHVHRAPFLGRLRAPVHVHRPRPADDRAVEGAAAMSAAAAAAKVASASRAGGEALERYRDDGPLARVLGDARPGAPGAARPARRLPAWRACRAGRDPGRRRI